MNSKEIREQAQQSILRQFEETKELPIDAQMYDGKWYAPIWGCDTLDHIIDAVDDTLSILGAEPAQDAIGTESNPFKGTYNALVFQRHDSELKLGIAERDDGFEFVVHGTDKEASHYALHPSAIMERLDKPAQDDGKAEVDD